MKFPTEWKVIKFHGSKAPTRKGDFQSHVGSPYWYLELTIFVVSLLIFRDFHPRKVPRKSKKCFVQVHIADFPQCEGRQL